MKTLTTGQLATSKTIHIGTGGVPLCRRLSRNPLYLGCRPVSQAVTCDACIRKVAALPSRLAWSCETDTSDGTVAVLYDALRLRVTERDGVYAWEVEEFLHSEWVTTAQGLAEDMFTATLLAHAATRYAK